MYNARDQIVSMKNICDDCGWVISQYDYTYDDRGFIVAEDAVESLYGYAWDDKHDGKHENWHDEKYPHGDKHINKHDKDGVYNFQIIETKRTFEYDEDGKLTKAVEDEDRQGQYIYLFEYDDMGNRTYYEKSRNGTVQESAACTYNAANQLVQAKIYNGKKTTTLNYGYDADGNRITETGKIGTDKVELTYTYTVENRLKAVHDADELLAAMAYDGDGNRIFMLNYNLHTDDDWKGNSGNGNGNNKDNSGSGSSGTTVTASEDTGLLASIVSFFTGEDEEETAAAATTATESTSDETDNGSVNGNKDKDKGNDGNDTNNGAGNGNGNSNGNSGNNGNGNGNSGSDETTDSSGTAGGNTTNTDGSTNQSGILFPIDGEVSELEQELIDLIKTTGKQKNYELVEYVNDVNREHTEVLMELNINGIMDTAYSYGNERLTNERFTGWTGYYTYDPRGSVTGVTDSEGMIWQSYRYDAYGNITFGKPQYNNVYSYNAESYNPNLDVQYLRARYYCPTTANFMTEDTYMGDITDPLTLNRYNYVKSSPLNYTDPSGQTPVYQPSNAEYDINIFSSRHQKLIENAEQWDIMMGEARWTIADYYNYISDPEGYTENLKRKRGAFIEIYKDVIIDAADENNISPLLLAGVAYMEYGGDPVWLDDAAYSIRPVINKLPQNIKDKLPKEFVRDKEKTSFGYLSMQVSVAIETLGYVQTCLDEMSEEQIVSALKDPVQNIYLSAMHLSDLRNIDFEGLTAENMTDDHIQITATRYNVGPDVSIEYVTSHLSYGATIILNKEYIERSLYGKTVF